MLVVNAKRRQILILRPTRGMRNTKKLQSFLMRSMKLLKGLGLLKGLKDTAKHLKMLLRQSHAFGTKRYPIQNRHGIAMKTTLSAILSKE